MRRVKRGPYSGVPLVRPTDDDIARFFAYVRKGPNCWHWEGTRVKGYGYFHLSDQGDRSFPAHRVAYAIAHGSCPAGLCVMHQCDVPHCVNPSHLRTGTQRDNMRDAMERGRMVFPVRSTTCRKCGAPRHTERNTRVLCHDHLLEFRRLQAAEAHRDVIAGRRERVPAGLPQTFAELAENVGERHAAMLSRNFGCYDVPSPENLSVIASDYGLTRERVRQIVNAACRRLGVEPRTFFGRIAV